MAYLPLTPLTVVASADESGKNPGNLTCGFDSSVPGMPSVNIFEIHHMVVSGGPPLAYASIILKSKPYSFVTLDVNGGNEWDAAQPAQLGKDDTMYYLWALAAPGTPGQIPSVTLWFRYDPDNPQNKTPM